MEPKGKAAVKFEMYNAAREKLKALTFLQQFDATYVEGNFTESSKIHKATTFLKGNMLQWWDHCAYAKSGTYHFGGI